MYTNAQIFPLLALVAHIASQASDEGCDGDLTVTAKSTVEQAAAMAQSLQLSPLQLALGVHSHKHGDSVYTFGLVPGESFSEDDFKAYLGDQFEEDREETVGVSVVPDKEIVQLRTETGETGEAGQLSEQDWVDTVNRQFWNDASQVIHLEGFIREMGLMPALAAYAKRAAAEENGEESAVQG